LIRGVQCYWRVSSAGLGVKKSTIPEAVRNVAADQGAVAIYDQDCRDAPDAVSVHDDDVTVRVDKQGHIRLSDTTLDVRIRPNVMLHRDAGRAPISADVYEHLFSSETRLVESGVETVRHSIDDCGGGVAAAR
jgi:hypothetical protein